MPKANGVARTVPTHFEKVPLEIVKVIAVEDLPTDEKVGVAIENVERLAKKPLLNPIPTRAPAEKKR